MRNVAIALLTLTLLWPYGSWAEHSEPAGPGHEVNGVVTKVKGWTQPESEMGKLTIHIDPISVGNARLHLTSLPPDSRGFFQKTKDAIAVTGQCIIYFPVCLAIKGMARSDSRLSGSAVMRSCVPIEFWVKSSAALAVSDISQVDPAQMSRMSNICSKFPLSAQDHFFPAYLSDVKFK
jgi:hypothetical protein